MDVRYCGIQAVTTQESPLRSLSRRNCGGRNKGHDTTWVVINSSKKFGSGKMSKCNVSSIITDYVTVNKKFGWWILLS